MCINPLYACKATPSTAGSDAATAAQYTPATKAHRRAANATASTGNAAAAATPLLSTAGAKGLFCAAGPEVQAPQDGAPEQAVRKPDEAADAEEETLEQDSQAVDSGDPEREEDDVDEENADAISPAVAEMHSTDMFGITSGNSSSAAEAELTPKAAVEDSAAIPDAQPEPESCTAGSLPVQRQQSAAPEGNPADMAAPRRAFPRTPSSAVRRSRAHDADAPTPIRNPLRVATPARSAPPPPSGTACS
jgi:hypothetical protein